MNLLYQRLQNKMVHCEAYEQNSSIRFSFNAVSSHLPPKFWTEALSTAIYVHNRSPTKALSQMTPHKVWTGKKPSVHHFRVFGCHSYIHVTKDERKKLDYKSKKCSMVLQAKAIFFIILQRKMYTLSLAIALFLRVLPK